jgi:hypothetical protein
MNIEWISVKDSRQPEAGTRYLVMNDCGIMFVSRKTVKGWLNIDSMPIPGVINWAEVKDPNGVVLL